MKKTPDTGQESSGDISNRTIVIFLAALGLSAVILNLWGDRLFVRAIVGVAWGGYCLFAFGPDLSHLLRGKPRRDRLR